jgi:hypothetical protein
MKILKYVIGVIALLILIKLGVFLIFTGYEMFAYDGIASSESSSFEHRVNELRELGVNVIYMAVEEEEPRILAVYYEPEFKGGDNQFALDYGLIIGYLYETENFDALAIRNYLDGKEVFSVYISYASIYQYMNNEITAEEFKNSWEVYS